MIDEKCLSDKFRGCRGTGSRAPVALAIRRIACSLPLAPWSPGISQLSHLYVYLTFSTVTENVTILLLTALSTRNRTQLG